MRQPGQLAANQKTLNFFFDKAKSKIEAHVSDSDNDIMIIKEVKTSVTKETIAQNAKKETQTQQTAASEKTIVNGRKTKMTARKSTTTRLRKSMSSRRINKKETHDSSSDDDAGICLRDMDIASDSTTLSDIAVPQISLKQLDTDKVRLNSVSLTCTSSINDYSRGIMEYFISISCMELTIGGMF